jgi:hypothetical protein
MKRAPNFSGMNKAIYGGENILGKRIHKVADHLLVPSDPSVVGRIRNRDFFLSASSTSSIMGGATSDPSRRPITRAPRSVGSTWACQERKFSRVSLIAGGAPT